MIDIVPRSAWGARTPRSRVAISTPTRELWLHHSAGSERGAAGVRQIQNFHMDGRRWSDIAYSFLVDRETLAVYEGRGAGIRGGHTFNHNSVSHGICVMGNFESMRPSTALLDRLGELVAHGARAGWWPERFTGGHRDVRSTSCPGRNLYSQIRTVNNTAATILAGGPPPVAIDRTAEITEAQTKLINAGGTRFYAGRPDGDFGPLSLDAVHQAVNRANEADRFQRERDEAQEQLTTANTEIERLGVLLDEANEAANQIPPEVARNAEIGADFARLVERAQSADG